MSGGVCNFLGSVLQQQKFEVMDRPCYSSVSQFSFIWQAKENTPSRCEGGLTQKTQREAPGSILAPLFICFFYPPEPALCKLGWPGRCLFYLRLSLWSWAYLCSIFTCSPLLCLLAITFLDSFFLF